MGQKFPRGYLKSLVVSEAGPPDECWLWPGYVAADGYGQVRVDGKTQQAHRIAYSHRHGTIPHGLVIDHTCHQRSCFNPSHLEAVTSAVNSQRLIRGPRKPEEYPRGYMQALVTSEAGAPDACWTWPGFLNHGGYGKVMIGGRMVLAHRAAYEARYGKIAEGLELDHACHKRACFNPRHLRTVSRGENMRNTRPYKNNTSGHPGVYWDVPRQKWRVCVYHDRKQRYLGLYPTYEEAVKVAKEARRQLGYTY